MVDELDGISRLAEYDDSDPTIYSGIHAEREICGGAPQQRVTHYPAVQCIRYPAAQHYPVTRCGTPMLLSMLLEVGWHNLMGEPNNPSPSEPFISGQELFTCTMPALPADSDNPIIGSPEGCLTKAISTLPGVELEAMVVAARLHHYLWHY